MSEDEKKIEVISGDGSELNISPVYDHISDVRPTTNEKKKNIVIPCVKKETKENEKDSKNAEKNSNEKDKESNHSSNE